eukprot:5577483-Alexandrium_andersonii.AAC.1
MGELRPGCPVSPWQDLPTFTGSGARKGYGQKEVGDCQDRVEQGEATLGGSLAQLQFQLRSITRD